MLSHIRDPNYSGGSPVEVCFADQRHVMALSPHLWVPALIISPLYTHYCHNTLELTPTFTVVWLFYWGHFSLLFIMLLNYFFFFSFLFLLLFYYSCPNSHPPNFGLLCPAHTCSHSQSPPCCLCPWVLYTISLTRPFPFFPPLPPPPPFWSLSVCSLFPCLWFCFACLFVLLIS